MHVGPCDVLQLGKTIGVRMTIRSRKQLINIRYIYIGKQGQWFADLFTRSFVLSSLTVPLSVSYLCLQCTLRQRLQTGRREVFLQKLPEHFKHETQVCVFVCVYYTQMYYTQTFLSYYIYRAELAAEWQ
jgi:hypothetical protein